MRDQRTTERIESMTITEFLLARIAEDEQMADEGVDGGRCTCRPNPRSLIARIDIHHPRCPLRVLSECEAKRRIVMECSEMQMSGIELAAYLATRTIWNLAQPFADHPHYREEWAV